MVFVSNFQEVIYISLPSYLLFILLVDKNAVFMPFLMISICYLPWKNRGQFLYNDYDNNLVEAHGTFYMNSKIAPEQHT